MSNRGTGAGSEGLDHLFGRPTARKSARAGPPGRAGGAEDSALPDLRRQFEDASREAAHIVDGLSPHQVNWRPGSGRWSIAECFGHLNIVGSEMLPVIDAAISETRARACYRSGPFRPRLVARWLLRATEPPVGHRKRAREEHVPHSDQAAQEALSALVGLNELLATRLQAAGGLDLSRPRISVPAATTLFRITLFELFLYLAAHGRRHLAQARTVREHPLFPRTLARPEQPRPSLPNRPGS